MKNRRCKKCTELGRDSTGDHLWKMSDGKRWCCNKPCHPVYYEDEDGVSKEDVSDHMDTVESIEMLPFLEDVDRGISKRTSERFGVRTELSEETGLPVAVYYPITSNGEVVAYKRRGLPKSFRVVPKIPDDLPIELTGQRVDGSGKKLLIVEGETDMLSAYQMLKDYSPAYEPSVVSLPFGSNTKAISDNKEFIESFEEVIVCTDGDESGVKCSNAIGAILGGKAKLMSMSEKDASDMLVKGKESEFINSFFKAKEYRPSSVVSIGDILEEIVKPVKWGLSYPWDTLTQLTYGMGKGEEGEIIGIGSGPGVGKSTLIGAIQSHIIFEHGERIASFDIEQGAVMCGKKLVGGIMGKPIHKPDCIYDQEEAREVARSIDGKVEIFDGHPEWDEIESNIRFFRSQGVRYFFIDPLSSLVQHLPASQGNEELGRVMKGMIKLRKELDIIIFHINHLNNPHQGKDHASGGKVLGSQFSGSRAQWKYSTSLWGITRDTTADTVDEQNTLTFSVIKDRLGGNTGNFNLFYDKDSGTIKEVGDEFL